MEIWLNPACSKCRTAVAELDGAGVDVHGAPLPRRPADRRRARRGRRAARPRAVGHRPPEGDPRGGHRPAEGRRAPRRLAAPRSSAHPRAIQRPIITAADGTTVVGRDEDSLARVIDAEA